MVMPTLFWGEGILSASGLGRWCQNFRKHWGQNFRTELILKSRRVVPGRLLEQGFAFEFPDWTHAAADLCQQSRERN